MTTEFSTIYHPNGGPDNKPYYQWVLTAAEREHISSLLGFDASTTELRGTKFNQQRTACAKCGKHSGLDDLVQNALSQGIHGKEFMIDILMNGTKGEGMSAPHAIDCSGCGERFEGLYDWGLGDEGW